MVSTLLILILVSNAFTSKKEESILYSRISIIGLLFTLYLSYNNLFIMPMEKGIGVYSGLFNNSTFTFAFIMFIYLMSAVILSLTGFFPRKVFIDKLSSIINFFIIKLKYDRNIISNKKSEQFSIIEYPLIILFVITGASFLISTGDIISIFLCIELQSYGLYIISSIYRDSELATGSALIYFLLGGLSSCFILLGSALLYANSGTTNLDNVYIIMSVNELISSSGSSHVNYYLNLSFVLIFVGFLFKVSAAPFHFWSPDVYDGIPTIVTTFVAIIAKISIFAFLLEVVFYTNIVFTSQYFTEFNYSSQQSILVVSSLLSLIIGSILGLTQFRIKRLFAYSTISHVGFILFALSINTIESVQSYIFYILQYSLSNLNAFIILLAIGFSLYFRTFTLKGNSVNDSDLIDQNNSPIQLINQIKGYFYVNPFIAISLSITLFSFVGIPPIIGFFAKQSILSAGLDNGYIFMTLVAILTSVIGAGYYLNLIKQIFFYTEHHLNYNVNKKMNMSIYTPNHKIFMGSTYMRTYLIKDTSLNSRINYVFFGQTNIVLSSSLSIVISIFTLLLILFMYMPAQWFNVVNILSLMLFKV